MGSFRRSPGLGIILLVAHVFNVGIERVPPVTLVTLTGMVALFLRIIYVPWNLYDVCLSAKSVLTTWDAKRLFISTFEHADDKHLYYSMVSFIWKGMTLENILSSRRFACLIVVFVFLVNIVYILLAVIASELLNDYSYVERCAVGFSGVIFALKVLTTYCIPGEMDRVFGIPIPRRWAVWLELVLIQLLLPNVSGLEHLAGILVGLLYVHTPLRRMIDFLSCTPSLEFEISPNPNQFIVFYNESGPMMIVPLSPSENARVLPEERFHFSPPLSVRLPTTS